MKHLILPILLIATAHAGEFDPARVSPDAKWWLHADLDTVRGTEVGKRIVSEIEARKGDQLNALKLMFSVNPLTDLGGITLYGNGKKDQAVALIDGRFERDHLEGLLKAADDYRSGTHADFTVHSWTDKKEDGEKEQHAAFVREDLIVFSERKSLLFKALDVIKSGAGMEMDPFVEAGSATPFLVGEARLSEVEMDEDESKLLRKADTLRVALAEAGDRMEGRMQVEVGKASDGKLLSKVLDGIMALASLTDDRLSDAGFNSEVRADAGGSTVNCTISVTSAGMISIMEKNGDFDRIDD